MIDAIKAYAFQGICVILLVLLGVQTWRLHGSQLEVAKLNVTISKEREDAALALQKAEKRARDTEQSMQASAEQTRKDANHAVSVAGNERNDLLKRLRVAESKLKSVQLSESPAASSNGASLKRDAGAELPATLGEADVEEAYRADVLRIELQSCYKQYDDAREALRKAYGD